MPRRVVVITLALVLLVVAVVGVWLGWRATQRTAYERAVSWLPESTLRATWTDWESVRSLAGGSGLDSSSTTREVSRFADRAYDLDLTSTSALVDATYALEQRYGFSPIDASWELLGQSREGAVVLLGLDEAADPDGIERNLGRLGYSEPAGGPGSGGVWTGSVDLVATVDPTLTPVMQNVVVLPDERVVLLSDSQAYASSAASVVTGDADGLGTVAGVQPLASAAGEPVTSVLWAADFACEDLGMGSVDEEDRAVADQLVEAAGGVSPLQGVVVALQEDRSLTVGLHFERSSQASDDLRPRVELASGEAPGQGGTFAERFRVVEAASDGNEIVMDLEPVDRDRAVFSDLTRGPLLFASC